MGKIHDPRTIYTDTGKPIPWFDKNVDNHLNRTTLIFGATKSGKTTIIDEILYLLKDDVPNFLVIAPQTSSAMYRKHLNPKCIKEDLSKKRLQDIWDRQYEVTQIYNIANDPKTLESLFKVCASRKAMLINDKIQDMTQEFIKAIDKDERITDFAERKAIKAKIMESGEKKIIKHHKNTIIENIEQLKLMKHELTDNQNIAVKFVGLNPNFCLVVDDSTEKIDKWMKYFKKTEENAFGSIFYKNRWNNITLIIAAHDDKAINTEFRKNSRVTIYTTSQSVITSINRTGNAFSSTEKKAIASYSDRIFGTDSDLDDSLIKNYKKLCYVRDDPIPFRYMQADVYPDFILGCDPLRKLADSFPVRSSLVENKILESYEM